MSGTNNGASGSGACAENGMLLYREAKLLEEENAVNPREEFGYYREAQRDYVFNWLDKFVGPANYEEGNFPVQPPEVLKNDFFQRRKQATAFLDEISEEEGQRRFLRERAAEWAWENKRQEEEAEAKERDGKRKAEIQANIETNYLVQGGRRKRHHRNDNRVGTMDLTEAEDRLNDLEPGPSSYSQLMSTGLVENNSGYIFTPCPRAPEGPPPFDRTNFPPLK